MTERFPRQRNRSAQRRADAHQVPVPGDTATVFDDLTSDLPVFDDSFVAAASVRELSAQARAVLASRPLDPQDASFRRDERTAARWVVRPSHHLAAVRPLPAVLALTCLTTVAVFLALLI